MEQQKHLSDPIQLIASGSMKGSALNDFIVPSNFSLLALGLFLISLALLL
jgi:hypothetical protein